MQFAKWNEPPTKADWIVGCVLFGGAAIAINVLLTVPRAPWPIQAGCVVLIGWPSFLLTRTWFRQKRGI